ncbi:HAD family hydrolase [Planomonospora venezuelensis]|uniref:HAD superfamily hydrolase (TIGR01509 family) n=1 Tax=Planomonospora venezuelensis TaxID=1999 RepID=A0A841CZE4_PLAVE|nr:HAD family phosphatase [Planomonospora venezuelensis]MBB5963361.1 HAD superfamily hydrolase (TIGR01509 family) [Planomonospora venezuelensis]GIN05247.1 haloacid dehalogenase [Planomonospora venezuelensis]
MSAVTRRTAAVLAGRRVWLCDLDGTLVDSAPAHEAAFRAALAEVSPGLSGSFDYGAHTGASTRQVVEGLGVDPALAEGVIRRKQRLYRAYVLDGAVPVLPGAHRLLALLADRGHTAYLVTSGSRDSVTRVLEACALTGYFRGVLTADDVSCSKPDPDFYRRACDAWAVDPRGAVVLEDSAHGVASAVGAGLLTLQVHGAAPAAGAVPVRDLEEIVSLLGTDDMSDMEALDMEALDMEENPLG